MRSQPFDALSSVAQDTTVNESYKEVLLQQMQLHNLSPLDGITLTKLNKVGIL